MDLTTIPLQDLEDLQKAVGEEISRRITAQNAPREIDRIIRRAIAAEGRTEGEPWAQPVTVGYPKGWRAEHGGRYWISTVANNVWEPGVSGWHPEPDDGPAPWVQPSGAHDAYDQGAEVTHGGHEWTSDLDGNVWEPGVHGWTKKG